MRKLNSVITAAIMILFAAHLIAGGFQLSGIYAGGSRIMQILSRIMTALIAVHIIIGIKLTADSIYAVKKSGAGYPKENKLFWLRRISGFAVMLFILCHILIFTGTNEDVYRLVYFGNLQLISQIMLVISLAVHIISNIKPLMISFGIRSHKDIGIDIAVIISVILLFSGIGFVIYFIRWNTI